MIQTDLHTPPLICCLRWKLTTVSPSGRASCSLGLKPKYRKAKRCKGCTGNVSEQIQRGFQEGLERGKKLPSIYDQLKAYVDEDHPPEAYKTEETEKPGCTEVKHGVWIDDHGDTVCSNCSFSCGDTYYLGSRKYCPECGAKMKDEE